MITYNIVTFLLVICFIQSSRCTRINNHLVITAYSVRHFNCGKFEYCARVAKFGHELHVLMGPTAYLLWFLKCKSTEIRKFYRNR